MDSETLSSIIRGYDASFDPNRVKAALDYDDPSALAEWAATHMSPDCLLTADELAQYVSMIRRL
jgi:hypothetical protein